MSDEEFGIEQEVPLAVMKAHLGACPEPEQLLAFREGELGETEQAGLKQHLSLCGDCQEVLAAYTHPDIEVDHATWQAAEKGLDARLAPWKGESASWLPSKSLLALAATFLVVVLAFLWIQQTPPSPSSNTRGPGIMALQPSGSVSELRHFRWETPPLAATFSLQVRVGEVVVWETTTSETEYPASGELLGVLQSGQSYQWKVQALNEAGTVILESGWVDFSLNP